MECESMGDLVHVKNDFLHLVSTMKIMDMRHDFHAVFVDEQYDIPNLYIQPFHSQQNMITNLRMVLPKLRRVILGSVII
ncbi:hypothetical protein Lalb_Chr05g0227691 [Lupinus albus]|uniref:Uncharacterized protein n=1 Tax=Lupinus albus TaxID=3870 RepID=A0A6A4QLT0_LUPAL|nr:hypothetical protein Lalb_Chr05g0227691 [Lupinus albus]